MADKSRDVEGRPEQHGEKADLSLDREREMLFFANNPDLEEQLAGEWVALDGDTLISHGPDLSVVLLQARNAGHPHPFVTRVPDSAVTFVF